MNKNKHDSPVIEVRQVGPGTHAASAKGGLYAATSRDRAEAVRLVVAQLRSGLQPEMPMVRDIATQFIPELEE